MVDTRIVRLIKFIIDIAFNPLFITCEKDHALIYLLPCLLQVQNVLVVLSENRNPNVYLLCINDSFI